MKRLAAAARIAIGATAIAAPLQTMAQVAGNGIDSPRKKPDQTTIAALRQRVPELMKEATVPGVSLALIRNGKTYLLQPFGMRDAKTGQRVTEETVFEAASLSKPVFAYGVLKLVEQGILDLDAPLSKYLPKPYVEGDARLDKITAR
ncbi:MAG TPA: serine hydrolase domain-containing protein, partial [Candidatus Limnocylindrales bacterium]|nr:serine hydrolase domain-containing protein [Candidatus Limnocylindrales bacterium]